MSITQIHLENQTTTPLPRDAARPVAKGAALWLNVNAPTDEDLDWLERTYRFHPLTIEDCRNFNQRAKVEAYDGYLFLSLTTTSRENGDLRPQEIEAFLGPDYLITVHREPLAALDAVREHYGSDKAGLSVRPDFLLYLIADHMVDVYFPLLDEVEDEIDALEDEILEKPRQATLHRIFKLKQQLVFMRKITAPMRDVMNALAGTRYGLVEEHTALYFRDIYDHLIRIYDLVETSRDLLGNALDAYLSTVSNRLNEVVKRLTIFTAIFMPISFLVGLGGINFQQMPFDNSLAFAIFLVVLALTPVATIIWFWRKNWL